MHHAGDVQLCSTCHPSDAPTAVSCPRVTVAEKHKWMTSNRLVQYISGQELAIVAVKHLFESTIKFQSSNYYVREMLRWLPATE